MYQLQQEFELLLNASCAAVLPHIPVLPASGVASFMKAYQAYNGSGSEAEVIELAAVLLKQADVQAFMATPWTGGSLDAAMVKCAVLSGASPLGLARFASTGHAQTSAVQSLLNDTLLMRDMLVAGGAAGGEYGQAALILEGIYNASTVLPGVPLPPAGGLWDDRNQSTMLHRLALGTALGHAVPIKFRYLINPNDTTIDPIARYLHYEKYYLAGDMDPALEVLTAFECSWTTNCRAPDGDLLWLRSTMQNFRPEHVAMDYTWRYAEAVHTDVAYGDPACA